MWECKYGKEPLDMKLCMLRLTRKWWMLLLSVIAGATLFGGIYFLTHVVYGPMKEYSAQSQYYIEYIDGVTQEQQYTFYNKETWENLVHTDLFTDNMQESLDDSFSKEEILNAVSATLLTDVRIVHATVVTNSPERTMQIEKALEQAFVHFASLQKEVEEVRIILAPQQAKQVIADIRTGRAAALGAVLSLCFTLFAMYLYVVMDDSVYLPVEVERRYKIPAEACDEEHLTDSVYSKRGQDGSAVLVIKAGDHNGTLIEQAIRNLKKENCEITQVKLVGTDKALMKAYYATTRFPWFSKK